MKKSDINPMPEYYERYINLVADVELAQAFDDSIVQLKNLDRNLLTKIDDRKYADDKWTVKEIIQHLIDWERILSFRTLLFARREGSIPQGIDQDRLAENMNAERRTIDELVDEYLLVRTATKSLFESFDDETLNNKGTNWKYELSVLAMGFTIIGHQINHLKIIEEKYYPLIAESLKAGQ